MINGHARILEEDLGEAGFAVDLADAADPHARVAQRHEDEAQAAMTLGAGIGAEDAEGPVSERSTR